MIPPAASHGTTSASVSSSLPAKSGRKTSGPSAAPKSAPKRTYEIPRARRSGGYMSAAAARARRIVPCAIADEREAGDDDGGRIELAAEGGRQAPRDTGEAAAGEHRDPAEPVHQPSGGKRGERSRREEDRRPEAEDSLDPGDEDERHRRHGDRELHHPGERGQRRREQDRVAPDREVGHAPSLDEVRRHECLA